MGINLSEREVPRQMLELPVSRFKAIKARSAVGGLDSLLVEDIVSHGASADEGRKEIIRMATTCIKKVLGLPEAYLPVEYEWQVIKEKELQFDVGLLQRIVAAESLEEELFSLLSSLSRRNRLIVLSRWCFFSSDQPTLREIGGDYGISGQRVSQIVNRFEDELSQYFLPLRGSQSAIRVIDSLGGLSWTGEVRDELRSRGIVTDRATLRLVAYVSTATSLWSLDHVSGSDVLATKTGARKWLKSGKLEECREEAERQVRPWLRRIGAVPVSVAREVSDLRPVTVTAIAKKHASFVQEINDFFVVRPNEDSVLVLRAAKTCEALGGFVVSRGARGILRGDKLDECPVSVFRDILASSDVFSLDSDVVTLTEGAHLINLLPLEELILEFLDEYDGECTYEELLHYAEGNGYPEEAFDVLMASCPFLIVASDGESVELVDEVKVEDSFDRSIGDQSGRENFNSSPKGQRSGRLSSYSEIECEYDEWWFNLAAWLRKHDLFTGYARRFAFNRGMGYRRGWNFSEKQNSYADYIGSIAVSLGFRCET